MGKKGLKDNVVRNRIKKLLTYPKTVTQLKKELPEISSLGTLAYHLKELLNKGIVKKHKEKNKQGSPTLYYLTTSKSLYESPEQWQHIEEDKRRIYKNEILNFLLKTKEPVFEGDIFNLIRKYEELSADDFVSDNFGYLDIMYEVIEDLSKEGLIGYNITPNGKKYLFEQATSKEKDTP